MSNPPAALNKRDELSGGNPGQDVSQPDQCLVYDSAILKVTKTKQVFFHFEIGFKRTGPKRLRPAAEAQAPPIEQAVPQPVLAFSAGAPRQPAPALDAAVAPPQPVAASTGSSTSGGSGSSTSGVAGYLEMKGGTSVTPPPGWPGPPM